MNGAGGQKNDCANDCSLSSCSQLTGPHRHRICVPGFSFWLCAPFREETRTVDREAEGDRLGSWSAASSRGAEGQRGRERQRET